MFCGYCSHPGSHIWLRFSRSYLSFALPPDHSINTLIPAHSDSSHLGDGSAHSPPRAFSGHIMQGGDAHEEESSWQAPLTCVEQRLCSALKQKSARQICFYQCVLNVSRCQWLPWQRSAVGAGGRSRCSTACGTTLSHFNVIVLCCFSHGSLMIPAIKRGSLSQFGVRCTKICWHALVKISSCPSLTCKDERGKK